MSKWFGGKDNSTAKKARPASNVPSAGSSGPQASASSSGRSSSAASGLPLNPQQASFAAVASGNPAKRSGPSPPALPRPQLRRGEAVLAHPQYASMERPAPALPAPNVLYVDMCSTNLIPEQVLAAVAQVTGPVVTGFELFAAQKAIALVFSSPDFANQFANKPIGDTGLSMYPAPVTSVNLLKLTLQGVPFWNLAAIKKELPSLLQPVGQLVFLAPMVSAEGFQSTQWHATIARPDNSTELPPDQIQIAGVPVIVDVPGQRRWCRHCEASTHIKASCRQGARVRSRQNQQAKDQAALDAHLQQQQQPALSQPQPQQTPDT